MERALELTIKQLNFLADLYARAKDEYERAWISTEIEMVKEAFFKQ